MASIVPAKAARIASRIETPSASRCSSQAGSKWPVRALDPRKVAFVALASSSANATTSRPKGRRVAGAQLAHDGHGGEDAEPAVVLASVAHGVVVAAGEQALVARAGVHAHHIAHRVDADLLEPAIAHPGLDLRGAGAVGVGQIGGGELATRGVLGLAVGGELLGPVPHQLPEARHMAELLVQADLRNAVDVAQALGKLELAGAEQAALEGGDDLGARQARAARPRTARMKASRTWRCSRRSAAAASQTLQACRR